MAFRIVIGIRHTVNEFLTNKRMHAPSADGLPPAGQEAFHKNKPLIPNRSSKTMFDAPIYICVQNMAFRIVIGITTQPCHCEPFSGEAISRLSGQIDQLGIASSQRTLLAMTDTTVLMQD
jgi:hypothetical protein